MLSRFTRDDRGDGEQSRFLACTHPSYLEPQAVLGWLLSLEVDNNLFAEGARFGKTAGSETGKTYE